MLGRSDGEPAADRNSLCSGYGELLTCLSTLSDEFKTFSRRNFEASVTPLSEPLISTLEMFKYRINV